MKYATAKGIKKDPQTGKKIRDHDTSPGNISKALRVFIGYVVKILLKNWYIVKVF